MLSSFNSITSANDDVFKGLSETQEISMSKTWNNKEDKAWDKYMTKNIILDYLKKDFIYI